MENRIKKSSKDVKSNVPNYDNRPCFNQIILADELKISLEIPPDFVKNYLPEAMPTKAVLKGPSGECWNITMWKKGKNASMQRGWQQFYQAHGLGDYELLSFMYNGNMCFDVHIFDKSGREMEYVSTARKHQQSPLKIKQEEEMDRIDIEETESQAQFTKKAKRKTAEGRNPASCSRRKLASTNPKAKVCKTAEDFTSKFPHFNHCLTKSNAGGSFLLQFPLKIKQEEEMDRIDIEETESQAQFTKKAKRKITEGRNPASCSRQKLASTNPKAKVCKTAEDFTSKFPHFKQCLTKSNAGGSFLLPVPSHFLAHLPEGRTEFTFYTAKEKSWKVALILNEINRVFSKGWRKFAIDNKLKILDICVFELVAPAQMRVHLFPHREY